MPNIDPMEQAIFRMNRSLIAFGSEPLKAQEIEHFLEKYEPSTPVNGTGKKVMRKPADPAGMSALGGMGMGGIA